jgi:CRP/FNR family transcriptional regulator, cyclic AMP receptor protein
MSSSTEPREGAKQPCGFSHCLDLLRDLPILSGVPLDVIKVLAYLSEAQTFAPGEVLCHQGEVIEHCCIVLRDEVAVCRRCGETETVLFRRGEGFFFGGLGLLAPAKCLFSVRTIGDAQCLVLTREKFVKTAERFPDILPKILANVVDHVFRWEEAYLRAHIEECDQRGGEMGLSLF